jgi:hypothetical protein
MKIERLQKVLEEQIVGDYIKQLWKRSREAKVNGLA